ncbi:MAG TPA: hypothetical protein DCM87_15850 [Planctomycetes bacterium]|nr:hypothetical protein [Planctomycetota bacterium]
MACAALLLCGIGWGRAAPADADAVRAEIAALLASTASTDAAAVRRAESRLVALALRAPEIFREEMVRRRREEALMAAMLGEGAYAKPAGLFFAEKLAEAQRALDDGRAAEARVLCEAVLALGCDAAAGVRATRLARLARDREFAGETFVANLRPSADVIGADAAPSFVLELWNRSDRPAKATMAVGLELQVSSSTLGTGGQPFSEETTELIALPKDAVAIEPGTAWEHEFKLKVARVWEQPYVIQRITARGRLVRVGIESGGRMSDRAMRVPHAVTFRAPGDVAPAVRDPIGAMRAAIAHEDAGTLHAASVVAAWEDKVDAAVEVLLEGARAPAPIGPASFVLLRLLSGQNHGTDRVKWIVWYLRSERVAVPRIFER